MFNGSILGTLGREGVIPSLFAKTISLQHVFDELSVAGRHFDIGLLDFSHVRNEQSKFLREIRIPVGSIILDSGFFWKSRAFLRPIDHIASFFRRLGVPTRPNNTVSNLPKPRGEFVCPVLLLKDPKEQFLEVDLFCDWFRYICNHFLCHLMDLSLNLFRRIVPASVQVAVIPTSETRVWSWFVLSV